LAIILVVEGSWLRMPVATENLVNAHNLIQRSTRSFSCLSFHLYRQQVQVLMLVRVPIEALVVVVVSILMNVMTAVDVATGTDEWLLVLELETVVIVLGV